MLVGPSKCLKQIIQIELNKVENPNSPEANQLAIYKLGRGFELETTIPWTNPAGGKFVKYSMLNFFITDIYLW